MSYTDKSDYKSHIHEKIVYKPLCVFNIAVHFRNIVDVTLKCGFVSSTMFESDHFFATKQYQ